MILLLSHIVRHHKVLSHVYSTVVLYCMWNVDYYSSTVRSVFQDGFVFHDFWSQPKTASMME